MGRRVDLRRIPARHLRHAKGWTEFWLIWIAVDVVGVPLLFSSGFYATGLMYVFYGVFTAVGFVVWCRAQANAKPQVETIMPDPRPITSTTKTVDGDRG